MSMTNRYGVPVLDPPNPQAARVDERETPVMLVLGRCALDACRRPGVWQWRGRSWCDGCITVALVRAVRGGDRGVGG